MNPGANLLVDSQFDSRQVWCEQGNSVAVTHLREIRRELRRIIRVKPISNLSRMLVPEIPGGQRNLTLNLIEKLRITDRKYVRKPEITALPRTATQHRRSSQRRNGLHDFLHRLLVNSRASVQHPVYRSGTYTGKASNVGNC